jgi:hypothetical protein
MSESLPAGLKRIPWSLVVPALAFGLAMAFVLYTRHAWEDYWITFRTSRHLAEGHGLVFNPGEKLHTFTSPLGVLLPALAYLLTLNTSDYAALWIFRVMSALAFAGAAGLLFATARRRQWGLAGAGALALCFALDAKTIDFSTNGMETGFLLLFLAWTLYALFADPAQRWRHLGLAWAGLMWTRPDSFIYIGALAVGALCFDRRGESWASAIRTLVSAGLLTTALYLPWLVFAGMYYGTPIPHTIVAKGLGGASLLTAEHSGNFLAGLPGRVWRGENSFAATFLPSYYLVGGWPGWMLHAAGVIGAAVALVWLLPFARGPVRAASLTFLAGHLYLSFATYFPFPWYLPTLTCCAALVLAGLFSQAWTAGRAWQRVSGLGLAVLLLGSGWLTFHSAMQLAAAQKWVEDGNRKHIGLYLQAHAKSQDTVFLEPLGYIGYFSQLEIYDFPGLSSARMIEARRKVSNSWSWADLINELEPTWLVLRDEEIARIDRNDPTIFSRRYRVEKVFDVSKEIGGLAIRGRPYLEVDRKFTLWRQQYDEPFDTPLGPARGFPGGSFFTMVGEQEVMFVHAPAQILVPIPAGAKAVTLRYGFLDKAYRESNGVTDGANFLAIWADGKKRIPMWGRILRPATVPEDRGLQAVTFTLPDVDRPRGLVLRVTALENIDHDWTYWSRPEFH